MIMGQTTFHRESKGQGLVEFALTIPFLLLLVMGVFEVGRLLFIYSSVSSASREAARFAAAVNNFNDCTGIRDSAKRLGFIAGVSDSTITIHYDRPPNLTPYATACPASGVSPGDRVRITVWVDYRPAEWFVHLPSFEVRSESVHTVVKDIKIYAPAYP
jgi:Flp pilus assembly protein TadG